MNICMHVDVSMDVHCYVCFDVCVKGVQHVDAVPPAESVNDAYTNNFEAIIMY